MLEFSQPGNAMPFDLIAAQPIQQPLRSLLDGLGLFSEFAAAQRGAWRAVT